MIFELFITILPSLIILLMIYLVINFITDINNIVIVKSLCVGIITILPAILTMKLLGILITISIPFKMPFIFFKVLSTLNEETFKYLSVKKFKDVKHPITSSIFIGGGFALCETLFLYIGNNQVALLRAYTTLPIHIISSILLYKSINKKRYFIYAILIHLIYNLF